MPDARISFFAKSRAGKIFSFMTKGQHHRKRSVILGIESGATRTIGILADTLGVLLHRLETGPGKVRLMNDAQWINLFRSLRVEGWQPMAVE